MPPIITPALNSAGTLEPGFMTTSGARSLDETHQGVGIREYGIVAPAGV
jgi:hypothetical protein